MGLKRNRKRSKCHHNATLIESDKKGPRILVINRGSVGPIIPNLIRDVQTMLSPNVVRSIKVLRSSRVQDLVKASGPLHISHAIIFTRTNNGLYMKLCTFPHGPTITFSLQNYSLQSDVLAYQKRPSSIPPSYKLFAPSLMMNNLQPHSGPKHLQLVASSMLQIFPKIVPNETICRHIRRCCLLNYDEISQDLDLRHYAIQIASTATAKLVSKLINSKKAPDLHGYDEIEDAFERDAASESEGEDDSKAEVARQLKASGNRKDFDHSATAKSSVKMRDCGPRITMKVHKIESGLLGGEVLYNRTQKRSAKEIIQLRQLREEKKKDRLARKQQQEANVSRKKIEAEQHRQRCLQGMPTELQERARTNEQKRLDEKNEADKSASDEEHVEEDSDDDAKYYKEEVGEDPDGITFSGRMKRRREKDTDAIDAKRRKLDEEEKLKHSVKLSKAKERYKMLDARRKSKRPSSYGKRLIKKMKTAAKQRAAEKAAEKKQEEYIAKTKQKKY